MSSIDDLALWSAPFGLVLLDVVRLRPGMRLLDVGCGPGFPLLELAGRLGPGARAVGLDPWAAALDRARGKARQRGLETVELVEGAAEAMPFADASFDVVVSNNGLNNVADQARSYAECRRVLAPGGQLVATMNLPASMHELYEPFAAILREREGEAGVRRLQEHIAARRQPVAQTTAALERAGFEVVRVLERSFTLRFASARALFTSPFIRLAFLDAWRAVPAPAQTDEAMRELEARLEAVARARGEVGLSIPFACWEARAR